MGLCQKLRKTHNSSQACYGCPNLRCPLHIRVPGRGKFSTAVSAQPPRFRCSTSWESHSCSDVLTVPGPRTSVSSGNPEAFPAYAGDKMDQLLESVKVEQFLWLCIYLEQLVLSPHKLFSLLSTRGTVLRQTPCQCLPMGNTHSCMVPMELHP